LTGHTEEGSAAEWQAIIGNRSLAVFTLSTLPAREI
jgi:hypothetical protein